MSFIATPNLSIQSRELLQRDANKIGQNLLRLQQDCFGMEEAKIRYYDTLGLISSAFEAASDEEQLEVYVDLHYLGLPRSDWTRVPSAFRHIPECTLDRNSMTSVDVVSPCLSKTSSFTTYYSASRSLWTREETNLTEVALHEEHQYFQLQTASSHGTRNGYERTEFNQGQDHQGEWTFSQNKEVELNLMEVTFPYFATF